MNADRGNMDELIAKAALALTQSRLTVALTGAGMSVESGIPPFRGKGGLWERFDPMEYAHIDALIQDPARVWNVLIREMKNVMDAALPNEAHKGLAALESMGLLAAIITQNVDGLHQAAGSTDVIEFHGNFVWQFCMDCGKRVETSQVSLETLPPLCKCGGVLRPDCVFFGEMIPPDALSRSTDLARQCACMLVAGTSAVVEPAASMARIAKASGAKVIEINLTPTPLTRHVSDISIFGPAGTVVSKIVAACKQIQAG